MNDPGEKTAWQGVLLSVQPRIRLTRSFDQRSHSYLGYALRVRGAIGNDAHKFLVGVDQSAHTKHQFQAGAAVCGEALAFRMRVSRRLNLQGQQVESRAT
jgi:hypothetical protein